MTQPKPAAPTDVIAIDGPAGAGKSSVARELARRLGYAFLDTGAMYRAAAWWVLEQGVDTSDADAIARAVHDMPLDLKRDNDGLRVFVGTEDVSDAIRTPKVTNAIRHLDGIADVRAHLVKLQREFAAKGPTVAEGRDMGTVVFPDARCKIYLDASIEERARRRAEQLTEQGIEFEPESLEAEIVQRDENDRNRKVAPLRQADDAIVVDTTGIDLETVLSKIEDIVGART